jgi:CheY-like chemotaxis protein
MQLLHIAARCHPISHEGVHTLVRLEFFSEPKEIVVMLWFPEWRVLVVDDDQDVLQITRMALKHVEVEGVPIKVITAASKAEAIEVLNTEFVDTTGLGVLTVALVDVVMETDTAGLELCDYIRNTLNNSVAQIYVRTGQPGVAPERDVIDRYDITGYFTKVEATEDKLYTMIKSGVRQYILSLMLLNNTFALQDAVANSLISQQRIGDSWAETFSTLIDQRGAEGSGIALWVGDTPVLCVGYDQKHADSLRANLSRMPATPISPMGDSLVVERETADGGIRSGLVNIAAGPNSMPAAMLSTGNSLPKATILWMITAFTVRAMATLWQQAGQRAYA